MVSFACQVHAADLALAKRSPNLEQAPNCGVYTIGYSMNAADSCLARDSLLDFSVLTGTSPVGDTEVTASYDTMGGGLLLTLESNFDEIWLPRFERYCCLRDCGLLGESVRL
ncbi:hypothetical protein K449DRAFT_399840 [Hypoxylon sp. EC38]|nr:hypothetical protein K449DRAFT_399840 [Hypoxylon sp. EC38]